MRRALTTFLLALCFLAASHAGAAAQERAPTQTGASAKAEAVGTLVSLLKKARAVTIPRTGGIRLLNSARAEGCVIRYNIVSEYESVFYASGDRTPDLNNGYRRTDREFTVNLADLDAALVRVWNPQRVKKGGEVTFYAAGGKEAVGESWVENYSRTGARTVTQRRKAGGFPSGDESSLEALAASLRRAIEVCAADAR